MKSIRSLLVPLPLLMLLIPAQGAEIVRVHPEFRTEESFHRILEFFTGREHTGRRDILRTDTDIREGFYLTTRLRRVDRKTLPRGTARLELAMPEEQETRAYEYSLESIDRRRPLVMFGITGEEWPEDLARPLAWKLTLLDAEGRELDSEQSFLWSMDKGE